MIAKYCSHLSAHLLQLRAKLILEKPEGCFANRDINKTTSSSHYKVPIQWLWIVQHCCGWHHVLKRVDLLKQKPFSCCLTIHFACICFLKALQVLSLLHFENICVFRWHLPYTALVWCCSTLKVKLQTQDQPKLAFGTCDLNWSLSAERSLRDLLVR